MVKQVQRSSSKPLKEIAADQGAPAAAEPAAVAAAAVEMPTQAPPAAEEAPTPDPNLPFQTEVAAAEALTFSSDVITTTATPSLPTLTSTATQELTAALELATLAISETAGVEVTAATTLSTTSGAETTAYRRNPVPDHRDTDSDDHVTLTPTVFGELEARKSADGVTRDSRIDLNDETVSASSAANVAPTGDSPTVTPTPEPVTPSPVPTAEPVAPATPEPTPAVPANAPLPAPEVNATTDTYACDSSGHPRARDESQTITASGTCAARGTSYHPRTLSTDAILESRGSDRCRWSFTSDHPHRRRNYQLAYHSPGC